MNIDEQVTFRFKQTSKIDTNQLGIPRERLWLVKTPLQMLMQHFVGPRERSEGKATALTRLVVWSHGENVWVIRVRGILFDSDCPV